VRFSEKKSAKRASGYRIALTRQGSCVLFDSTADAGEEARILKRMYKAILCSSIGARMLRQ